MTVGKIDHAFDLVTTALTSNKNITVSYITSSIQSEYAVWSNKVTLDGSVFYDIDQVGFSQSSKNIVEFSLLFGLKSFIDVNFTFVSSGGNLEFGQLLNGPAGIYGWAYLDPAKRGDFWLTPAGTGDSSSPPLPVIGVPYGFETIPHETGHSLGLDHTHLGLLGDIERPGWSERENTSQFSIMSYNYNLEDTRPLDYQLYDIAALQKLYGPNFAQNNDTNTYQIFHENAPVNGIRQFGGAIPGSFDRMYSIWDGGGTDTIDASAYTTQSSLIDLRPGHFSSIGPKAFTPNSSGSVGHVNNNWTVNYGQEALGRENISVAFGAYIEDARGGDQSDVIIGNMLTNHLEGLSGNDLLFADGFAIELADKVLTTQLARAATGLLPQLNSSSDDADYRQIDIGGPGAIGDDAVLFVYDRAYQTNFLEGGYGNDLLAGSYGKDTLDGGADNDLLIGDRGEDTLTGGSGTDILFGNENRDLIFGGSDADDLYGGDGNDVAKGDDGDDRVYGEDGNDWLEGGDGIDLIEGGAGNDRLTSGKGDDKDAGSIKAGLYGGGGDDLFVTELNDGDDTLNGGSAGLFGNIFGGTDTVVYKYAQGNSTIKIVGGAWFSGQTTADFGLSISNAQDASGAAGSFGSDTLTSIEKASVEAGSGADTLLIDGKSYYGYLNYVDLGGQGAGFSAYDVLNAGFATTNITVDLRDLNNQNLTVNDGFFSDSTLC